MNDLREAEDFLRANLPPSPGVLCAVSGGLDSMCLLHFAAALEGVAVTAAHFDHGLRGENAARDRAFVERWCRERGIPCITERGDTPERMNAFGESAEEAARNLRYAFLERAGAEFDAILTAHHADDNAETVLLQLLRGTGTAGLAGIPRRRGKILRPFLLLERQTLEEYAANHGIDHVEDETNGQDIAARNVLRHKVLPVLKELNPRAAENISRAAAIAAREHLLVETEACRLADEAERDPAALSRADEALAGRAALELLSRHCGGRKDLTARHARQLCALCGKDRGEGSFPGGVRVKKDGGTLEFFHTPVLQETQVRPETDISFGPWRVELSRQENGGWPMRLPGEDELRLTLWRSSDRMALPGARGKRSLKRLCTDKGIDPARRDSLPVLRVGEDPAAAALLGVDEEFAPKDGEERFYIKFYFEGESV